MYCYWDHNKSLKHKHSYEKNYDSNNSQTHVIYFFLLKLEKNSILLKSTLIVTTLSQSPLWTGLMWGKKAQVSHSFGNFFNFGEPHPRLSQGKVSINIKCIT